MRRQPARLVAASALLLAFAGSLHAQQGATKGEWRYYGGDAGSTKYSPLDQINAKNVKELEIVWRWKAENFGPPPDFNWEVTPLMIGGVLYFTAGTRRDVVAVDAATGETLWMYRLDEGERGDRAARDSRIAASPTGPTARATSGILLISPGYQLVALNAKTGRPIPAFGKDGIVDLTEGLDRDVVKPGQIGSSSPAIVVRDVVVVGAACSPAPLPRRRTNVPGYIRGFDVRTGKRIWTFQTIPQPGEFGNETWEKRLLEVHRQHRRLGAADRRRRARLRLHPRRDADRRFLRRPPAGRQSVRRQPGVPRREDRQAHLALPARPSRHLGLGHRRRRRSSPTSPSTARRSRPSRRSPSRRSRSSSIA